MPEWQPIWADVRFDHAAASAASDHLRRTAASLGMAGEERAWLATAAVEQWKGRFRQRFDTELQRVQSEGSRLSGAMRILAAAIDAASVEVASEQTAREASRVDWYRQQAAEEAAAAAAAA